MQFLFNFDLSLTSIILLSAITLCVIFHLTLYRCRIARIAKHQQECSDSITYLPTGEDEEPRIDTSTLGNLPTASIIVYANDETSHLAQLLPQILEQEYTAKFEVIVVNDGASESTQDLVSELELRYPNLYYTHTPDRSRNLSRKKLALTIGIKAARYDVIVLVNANSRINSPYWLSLMTRNFNDKTDVVIGYATPQPQDDTSMGRRRRAFDRVAEAVTYLSAAIGKSPYRGFNYNLAYRRSCFFDNKGFSHSLNLHYGDDDVFINEITNSHNTAVELSPESIVECHFHGAKETHRILKRRYSYTSRFIRKGARIFFGFSSLLFWAWALLSIVTIVLTLPNLLPTAIVVALGITLWIPTILTWRKAMITLKSRRLFITIPWFVMTRPFYNARYKFNSRRNYRQHHTWIKR